MITADRLRQLLDYDPATGIFRWKANTNPRHPKKGEIAGNINSVGHRRICIDGRFYQASRLCWLYMTGCWPTGYRVRRINGIVDDNRWANLCLRLA
ncbi:HNH endonuclease [Bradyrhizobium sp. DASA03120]|uniref:HNH endonuclease n=1 Tax=Bradyrhizobium sp. SMVTL-02 TaxID=3395917 RepID=UPI003F6FAE20